MITGDHQLQSIKILIITAIIISSVMLLALVVNVSVPAKEYTKTITPLATDTYGVIDECGNTYPVVHGSTLALEYCKENHVKCTVTIREYYLFGNPTITGAKISKSAFNESCP